MGKFIAKITGKSDGYSAAREFNDFADAQAWLRGDGLREFDDQTARGEIFSPHGEPVWFASHLEAVERSLIRCRSLFGSLHIETGELSLRRAVFGAWGNLDLEPKLKVCG